MFVSKLSTVWKGGGAFFWTSATQSHPSYFIVLFLKWFNWPLAWWQWRADSRNVWFFDLMINLGYPQLLRYWSKSLTQVNLNWMTSLIFKYWALKTNYIELTRSIFFCSDLLKTYFQSWRSFNPLWHHTTLHCATV